MKHPFSQNKSKLGDSIAQQIPFEGEHHYLPQSRSQGEDRRGRIFAKNTPYSNAAFPSLILAVLIILVGGCFAIVTSSDPTVTPGDTLFYLD
jgi:hypothetical protein